MSLGRIAGISTNNNELSDRVKSLISSIPLEPTAKLSEDCISTKSQNKTKGIPINIFRDESSDEQACRVPNIKDVVTPESKDKATQNKTKLNELYSHIGNSFKDRYTGKENDYALQILLNDNLRGAANDIQKTNLLKIAVFALDEEKDPQKLKQLSKGIDNIINDFQSSGKMKKLVEFIQINLTGTGTFLTGMHDYGINKLTENDKILSATNPAQKADMLYRLKRNYTSKIDEQGIINIVKKTVEQGQLKSLMGYWSDGIDPTSTKMDSLYANLSGQNQVAFLRMAKTGIEKEKIGKDVMSELYGGNKILADIDKLDKAGELEKEKKFSEAGQLYTSIGDLKKGKELLEMAGYQDMQQGNYLNLVKDFIHHSKADLKTGIESSEKAFSKLTGTHLSRTATSYIADKVDNAFKDHPILQAKNVLVLKDERDKSLERLNNIVLPKLTESQKALNNLRFEKKVDELTGTKSVPGNKMQMLIDGGQAFERMKTRIENSKESIYIEVFLFHDDKKGNEIADALIKKANEGLDVRVVVDGTMNSSQVKLINKLKNSKVQFIKNKGSYDSIIENRGLSAYHRKLYIFDKKVAMTGGINVGNEYLTQGKWHDMLVEVQGPVMSDTLNDFYKHWNFSKGGNETTLEKAPPPSAFKNPQDADNLPTEGTGKVRLITTDPNEKKKNIKIWMHEAIQNARERVFIQDPYFNDPEILKDLKDAVARGVKVEVILPNSNDVPIMKHLDDNILDELYAAGANVYMYNTSGKESFNHLKATVVDDMVALGSSNKDVRAMNTNQEINYVFDDKKFAQSFLTRVWDKDKENCTPAEVTPENFAKRLIKQALQQVPSLF